MFHAWIVGGSGVLVVTGIGGMIVSRRWELLCSFLLMSVYVFVSYHDYYAILFTPLFIAGTALLISHRVMRLPLWILIVPVVSAYFLLGHVHTSKQDSKDVMQLLSSQSLKGEYILIHGNFGHDWQYYSPLPVRRYREAFIDRAAAIVCLSECRGFDENDWMLVPSSPSAWVHK